MQDNRSCNWNALATRLASVVGDGNVLINPLDLALYDCDAETLDRATPDLVVLPGSHQEVQSVLKIAHESLVPITPRGAGTGLSGGSTTVYGGLSLVLTRMNRVLSIDAENLLAHVQVGATNASVSKAAEEYGLHFAPDPSSQTASTVGGNIAENAGGAHTLKYGLTGQHVVGMRLLLSDGKELTDCFPYRASQGLDLNSLVIGSEGTLAIVTEVYLRLTPVPSSVQTLLSYFPDLDAGGKAVSAVIATGIVPAAMEMIDRLTLVCVEESLKLGLNLDAGALLIVELDGVKASIEAERAVVEKILIDHGATNLRWAMDKVERLAIWKARKAAFASMGRLAPNGYVLDGVIPRSRLAEAIAKIEQIAANFSIKIANVYHAGDGNLHPCLLYDQSKEDEVRRVLQASSAVLEACVELGGTLSGEHGIGVEKLKEMAFVFEDSDLESMKWLRQSFDNSLMLNPGKILPNLKSCGESGARPLLRHRLSMGC